MRREDLSIPAGGSHTIGNRLSLFSLVIIAAASFWSTAVVEMAAGLLVIGSLLKRLRDGTSTLPPRSVFLLWTVYFAGGILSAIASPYKETSIHALPSQWHALLFPAACIASISPRDLKLVGLAFIGSGSLAASAAIIRRMMEGLDAIEPFFIGSTTFADLAVLACLVGLGVLLVRESDSSPTQVHRRILALLLIPIGAAISLSALKGPVCALIAGSLALVIFLRPRAFIWWVLLMGLIFVISPRALFLKMEWFVMGGNLDRYTLWTAGFALLAAMPMFGYGPGSFSHILSAETSAKFFGPHPMTWHNDFLQIVLESGWIVGACYVTLVAVVVVQMFTQATRTRDPYRRSFLATAIAALSCLVFFATFGSVIFSSILCVVWWCTLGIIVHLLQKDSSHEVEHEGRSTGNPESKRI